MTADQLRQALTELNGQRHVEIAFTNVYGIPQHGIVAHLSVKNAMLVPDESDHLVKLTDGLAIYILDAERIAWIKIG